MGAIAQKAKGSIVYLDEMGMNDNEEYEYGWGEIGQRLYAMKKAVRSSRLSVIGALIDGKLDACGVFDGVCDRALFERYLEEILVPRLRPKQTIIMDNASFHKGGNIEAIINKAGCELLYLPSYSPDYNPIENCWSGLKTRIRQLLPKLDNDLMAAIEKALALVPT